MEDYYGTGRSERVSAKKIAGEMNRGKRKFLENMPHIIAVLLLILTALMTFADFRITNLFTENVFAGSALFLIASYIMYFVQKNIGKKNGALDEEFLRAREEHKKICGRITEDKEEDRLPDFVRWYTEWELTSARRAILAGSGLSYDKWLAFAPLGGLALKNLKTKRKLEKLKRKGKITEDEYNLLLGLKALPQEQRIAATRACLLRKQNITVQDLTTDYAASEERISAPRRLNKIDRKRDLKTVGIVTFLLCVSFSLAPEVVAARFGISTLITALTRILSLLTTGWKGNYNGETLFSVIAVQNYMAQVNILGLYDNWKGLDCRSGAPQKK